MCGIRAADIHRGLFFCRQDCPCNASPFFREDYRKPGGPFQKDCLKGGNGKWSVWRGDLSLLSSCGKMGKRERNISDLISPLNIRHVVKWPEHQLKGKWCCNKLPPKSRILGAKYSFSPCATINLSNTFSEVFQHKLLFSSRSLT